MNCSYAVDQMSRGEIYPAISRVAFYCRVCPPSASPFVVYIYPIRSKLQVFIVMFYCFSSVFIYRAITTFVFWHSLERVRVGIARMVRPVKIIYLFQYLKEICVRLHFMWKFKVDSEYTVYSILYFTVPILW